MTRVDFYILQDVALDARSRFACRLATKAVSAGHPVYLHAGDESHAAELDELLWSYPDGRFVPHELGTNPAADAGTGEPAPGPDAPVLIGWREPPSMDGVLINLSGEVPLFFGRFDRLAEIVVRANRDEGRDRYKFYRDRGYPLFHHELEDWEGQ